MTSTPVHSTPSPPLLNSSLLEVAQNDPECELSVDAQIVLRTPPARQFRLSIYTVWQHSVAGTWKVVLVMLYRRTSIVVEYAARIRLHHSEVREYNRI